MDLMSAMFIDDEKKKAEERHIIELARQFKWKLEKCRIAKTTEQKEKAMELLIRWLTKHPNEYVALKRMFNTYSCQETADRLLELYIIKGKY